MSNLPDHPHCPECGGTAPVIDWLPEPGFDPAMRQYKCSDCHYEFYLIPKHIAIKGAIEQAEDLN